MTSGPDAFAEHRRFLNAYYGASRRFYDLTRKHYLFGRDTALATLAEDLRWRTLVEVGPGTGRNVRELARRCVGHRSGLRLGGIEASDAMLEHARERLPGVPLLHGFAETAPYREVFGTAPDRILFSYCLSMVEGREEALAHARRSLAPGGEVVVVDFADLAGLPRPLAAALRRWLAAFRVTPLDPAWLAAQGARVELGPGRYYVIARCGPAAVA